MTCWGPRYEYVDRSTLIDRYGNADADVVMASKYAMGAWREEDGFPGRVDRRQFWRLRKSSGRPASPPTTHVQTQTRASVERRLQERAGFEKQEAENEMS